MATVTLNVYSIPVAGKTKEQYYEFVTNKNITFNGDRSVTIDPTSGIVKVDGTIAGLTPTGTEDVEV